jgi:hypothetical protein
MRSVGAPQNKAQLHHVGRTRNRVVRPVLDGIENDLAIEFVTKDNNGGMGRYLADFVHCVEATGSVGALGTPRPQIKQNHITPFAQIRYLIDL